MMNNTNNNLPVRRGVVMRADGISDSYGKRYHRDPGTGQLYRLDNYVTESAPAVAVSDVVDAMLTRNDN